MKIIRILKQKEYIYFASFLFFLMLLCLRGMLLGNLYPVLGACCGLGVIIITFKKNVDNRIKLFFVCLLFWFYCVLQGIITNSNDNGYLVQILLYWIIEVGAALCMFQSKNREKIFIRILIIALCLMVFSYIITFAFGCFLGWEKLLLGKFDYNYFYSSPFFLPLTLGYGSGTIKGITVYRLLGIARESGIMQCIFSWAFFAADHYFKRAKAIKLLMLLGVIACMSTTGFVLFFATLILNQLTKQIRKVFSFQTAGVILIVLLAVYFLMGDSTFGWRFRFENSFGDRMAAMDYGLKNLQDHFLFGIGFFKNSGIATIQAEVNLIAALGNIGAVGGVLFLLIYFIAFMYAEDKRYFLTTNAVLFLTTLTAQPLYVSPLIYIFLFLNYKKVQDRRK